jgi:hypothetical protein
VVNPTGTSHEKEWIDIAHDDLLRLSGPASGNPIEAAAITADGDLAGGYRYVGKYSSWIAEVRVAGAFDRTTGDETMAIRIYEATDSAGTGAAVIATGNTLTATHAANLGASTANGKTAGTLSDGPSYLGFTTGAGGWVKANADMSGTTPSAASVSVDLVTSNNGAFRQSGT